MFGLDTNLLAMVVLAGFSVAALAYAFLYQRIEEENRTSKRMNAVRASDSDRSSARSDKEKVADGNKRRKAVQDNLKDFEARQKNREKLIRKPPLKTQILQAGLTWNIKTFYIASAVAGVAATLIAFLIGVPLYAVPGAGLVFGVGLPRWVVSHLRKKRIKQFISEFANSIDIIVRAVKSGLPLNDGLRLIATEAKEPVRTEFRRIIEAQQIGLSIPEAVAKMYETMPCAEANFFGIVIQIQTQAGGNLSEALGNLSRVIRDRKKMRAKVDAMSMEAKASAAIIACLPFIVTGLVYLSSPGYILVLFTTTTGNTIIGVSFAWMSIGVMVMKKMINFDL